MRKKLGICLTLLIVIPGLLFAVSCATKKSPGATQAQVMGKASAEELAMQEKRLEEEAIQTEIETARNMFINEDIYFEFNRSDLSADSQEILKRKANWLRNNAETSVTVEGHCDERGTTEYNLALGDRRAESAKKFLINMGIASSRLIKISYGEEMPVDSGQNESAWAKNRRAHFSLK